MEQSKITLTELQRYLPIPSPNIPCSFPQEVVRFLSMPVFTNLSILQQNVIKKNYQISYRNYFKIEQVVKHISLHTKDHYTYNSIRMAVQTKSLKYGLIDWFHFIRSVYLLGKKRIKKQYNKQESINLIIWKYRQYKKQKIVWIAIQQIQQLKHSLEQKIIVQFSNEILRQIKQFIDKNRNLLNEIKNNIPQKLTFINLNEIINKYLFMYMQKKKVMYLYLHYDKQNKGYFKSQKLLKDLMIQKKKKIIKKEKQFLTNIKDIFNSIRIQMRQRYYSVDEMIRQYNQEYNQIHQEDEIEIDVICLKEFINQQSCESMYSFYQIRQVTQTIKFYSNLQYLYNQPNFNQLSTIIQKIINRKAKKKSLHSQNQIYYYFKNMLYHLIARCKRKKINKQQLIHFMAEYNPLWPSNAFYCVWRKLNYIDIEQIRKECGLSELSIILQLKKTSIEYDKIYEQMKELYPENKIITYGKLEQQINLNMQFILEIENIKLIPQLGQYDLINYHEIIHQVLQINCDEIIRKYIFRKVAEKLVQFWKLYQLRKQNRKKKQKIIEKVVIPHLTIPEKVSGINKDNRKINTDKSSSMRSKKQQIKYNIQHLQLTKQIIYDIIGTVDTLSKKLLVNNKFNMNTFIKKQLLVLEKVKYTFRCMVPDFTYSELVGHIALGAQILFLNNNNEQNINLKIPYRYKIQIIGLSILENNLILLTSYLTLEFYHLAQKSKYPIYTIQLCSNDGLTTTKYFQNITTNYFYGIYPVLIKCNSIPIPIIIVNTTYHNNKIYFIHQKNNQCINNLSFTQKQHLFISQFYILMNYLKQNLDNNQCKQFITTILQMLNRIKIQQKKNKTTFKIEFKIIEKQIYIEFLNLIKYDTQNDLKQKFSIYYFRTLMLWFSSFNVSILICYLKNQLELIKNRIIPEWLKQVLNSLMDYMRNKNLSVINIINQIDKNKIGLISIKSLKDYLLKITKEIYIFHQKEIDIYLKSITNAKQVSYENFMEIMKGWELPFWQYPILLIQDYQLIAYTQLLIYTLQGFNDIFIKHIKDNKLIAKLKGHHSTPTLTYISEKMLVISADTTDHGNGINLMIWRLYQDLLCLYQQHPPWIIQPSYTFHHIHEQAVTSISYLKRSHHLLTTSMDSTIKFWQIKKQPLQIIETKRLYSEQFYYLASDARIIHVNQTKQCNIELLTVFKINKQINQKNKYKLQGTIRTFTVQKMKIQVNEYLQHLPIPMKLKNILQDHAKRLINKKQCLQSKKNIALQKELSKSLLIADSLEQNIYHAIKKSFIFNNDKQLKAIVNYVNKNQHSNSIMNQFYIKYGLHIVEEIITNENNIQIQNESKIIKNQSIEQIQLPSEQYEQLMEELKPITHRNGTINYDKLIEIVNQYLFGYQMLHFQKIIENFKNKQKEDKNKTNIEINFIQQIFKIYQIQSQIDKFYAYLRSLKRKLIKNNIPIWCIFVTKKDKLQNMKSITIEKYTIFLKKIQIKQQRIQLMTTFLAINGKIHISDLLYYFKVAEEHINPFMSQNLSEIMMMSQSYFQGKIINQSEQILDHRNSHKQQNSSKIHSNKSKNISEMQNRIEAKVKLQKSISSESRKIESQKDSQKDSQKQESGDQDASVRLSQSNSLTTLSKDKTYTKDSIRREISQIIHHFQEMIKNQNKSLWELVALSIPQFMSKPIISQNQYFSIFLNLKTQLRLLQKLQLLDFLRNEGQGQINLNLLFDLVIQGLSKGRIYGQKYVMIYIIEIMMEGNLTIDQSLEKYFYSSKQQLSIENLLTIFQCEPFIMPNYAIKEIQLILLNQNKLSFQQNQLKEMLLKLSEKYQLKIQDKKLTILEQIQYINNKGINKLQEIFPQQQKINYKYFKNNILNITPNSNEKQIENIYIILINNIKKKIIQNYKNIEIKYSSFINQLLLILQQVQHSKDKSKEAAKKFMKSLNTRKINLFAYYCALDRNHNYFINELQFQTGLNELGITFNFWVDIIKSKHKKLYYHQLINHFILKGIVNYKCVDSQLQKSMDKFIKRYIRQEDIENIYNKLRIIDPFSKNPQYCIEVNFQTFQKALRPFEFLKEDQVNYLFGAFVNSQQIRNSKSGTNDDIIKNISNQHKTFNFKQFTDVIGMYKAQNITKTPHYKMCDYLKKRNISLLHEFCKFMDRNKKQKDIAQALKKKTNILPKNIFAQFIEDLNVGLNEKQRKEMLYNFPQNVQFAQFNNKIQQIYLKGNQNVGKQEIQIYLQQILKLIQQNKVTIQRLFNDFTKNDKKMNLRYFSDMCQFLNCGFNKIILRQIFTSIDIQKKGYISCTDLTDAMQKIAQIINKQDEYFELEYITQKLFNNSDKYNLKSNKIIFTIERAKLIFQKILTQNEIIMIYKSFQKQRNKAIQPKQKQMNDYLIKKGYALKMRRDKKYNQLLQNLLKFLKKINIQAKDMYHYFSKDSNNMIPKNKFLVLYQSLQMRATMIEINSLYDYFDSNRDGRINLSKWQQKLNLVSLQMVSLGGFQGDELKIFYKVKIFLTEMYLTFLRKMFKPKQIYNYFDEHGSGQISYSQFWTSIIKLGLQFDHDIEIKVNNYLDKNKQKIIPLNFLIQELENCLGSKTKLVLQTKTSTIFKSKQHIFQERKDYFIRELARNQCFIELEDGFQSCILEADFVELVKKFGIYLMQDQINDIRLNFLASDRYLLLYRIYFMFNEIFKQQIPINMQALERQRYHKLFESLIKNNITLKQLNNLHNNEELSTFLEQLKIFTPIEVKLITQSVTYSDSTAINLSQLKKNIRNSYINATINIDLGMIDTDTKMVDSTAKKQLFQQLQLEKSRFQLEAKVRNSLRELIISKGFTVQQILGANHGKINFDIFKNLLNKCNISITVKNLKKYFEAYSGKKYFILIEDLIQEKKQCPEKNKEQDQSQYQKQYTIMMNHIYISLQSCNKTLSKALEYYYGLNYGEIDTEDWLEFLKEIGYDIQKQSKVIEWMINKYQSQYQLGLDIPKMMCCKLEQMIRQSNQCQNELSNHEYYSVGLKHQIKGIQTDTLVNSISQQLETWMNEHQVTDLSRISRQIVYKFLRDIIHKNNIPIHHTLLSLLINLIPLAALNKEGLCKFIRKILCKKQPSQIVTKIFSQFKTKQQTSIMQYILSKNFIHIYELQLSNFIRQTKKIKAGSSNLHRLALTLLLQELLTHQHLLTIRPVLGKPILKQQINKILFQVHKNLYYQVQTKNTFTIENQYQVPQSGYTLINDHFHGISIESKEQFHNFATVATLLNPQIKFIRVQNYFIWEKQTTVMPKGAINYRWKYIFSFAKQLTNEIMDIHKCGYCIPHLRWNNLSRHHGSILQKIPFPCPIDNHGKILKLHHPQILNFDDAYCVPEFLQQPLDSLKYSCDTWVFGCLLYEFIWGHIPKSYISQLRQYLDSRRLSYTEQQVLLMEESPYEFLYLFFNVPAINNVLAYEHQLQPDVQPYNLFNSIKLSQSYQGLTRTLHNLYTDEYMYYKEEFKMLSQLHGLIQRCLCINPALRPSIEQISAHPLIKQADIYAVDGYYEALDHHCASEKLVNEFIQPIKIHFHRIVDPLYKANVKQYNDICQLSSSLNTFLHKVLMTQSIPEQLCIPKYFAWPSSDSTLYNSNLLANKTKIRQSGAYNILILLFRGYALQMLVFMLKILANDSHDRGQQLGGIILRIYERLCQDIKDYHSPLVGFIGELLDGIMKLIYDEPSGLINVHWWPQVCLIDYNVTKSDYYNIPELKSCYKQLSLQLLRRMVSITGQGRIQYYPVMHFLMEQNVTSSLLESFYVAISILEAQSTSIELAINYFTDRINDETYFQHAAKLRVEVLLLKVAINPHPHQLLAMSYLSQLIATSKANTIPLFKYALLYTVISNMLSNPIQKPQLKILAIDMIISLFRQNQFTDIPVNAPSNQTLKQILKLMIIPPINTPQRNQFELLSDKLNQFSEIVSSNSTLLQQLSTIQGYSFILQAYQNI